MLQRLQSLVQSFPLQGLEDSLKMLFMLFRHLADYRNIEKGHHAGVPTTCV